MENNNFTNLLKERLRNRYKYNAKTSDKDYETNKILNSSANNITQESLLKLAELPIGNLSKFVGKSFGLLGSLLVPPNLGEEENDLRQINESYKILLNTMDEKTKQEYIKELKKKGINIDLY
jgi:hypothetical protein